MVFHIQDSIDYQPDLKCPKIAEFLSQITDNKNDQRVLFQLAGYCLYRDYTIHKAFFLYGDGANGKSTYLELLRAFLGPDNVSHRSLQEICDEGNRFVLADLYGRLANAYADIPHKTIFQTGRFKMLTGHDTLTAEKKFKDSFNFRNYAKLIFSANELPPVGDETHAFWRRIRRITFPNKFEGDNCDHNILAKLTTSQELSGFLNAALAGLNLLLEAGEFEGAQDAEQERQEYIRQADPVQYFADERLEKSPLEFIQNQELYEAYIEFCMDRNLKVVGKTTMYRHLDRVLPSIRREQRKIEGKKEYVTIGIRFKRGEEDKDAEVLKNSKTSDLLINGGI